METESGEFKDGRVTIKYRFRKAQKDNRHLVVIFSGFRRIGDVDFAGKAISSLRANILWIVDDFSGHFSYYMRAFGGEDIAPSIRSLVELFRNNLGLHPDQVTFAGFSKGGSAAIYHGVTSHYRNVVATVPQRKIGSYVQRYWAKELASMGGPDCVAELDAALDTAIAADPTIDRSIYLITSPEDDQYLTEAIPLASKLRKYDEFNLIVSVSPLVRRHIDVTRYNVPLILSILATLSEGIAPRFGSLAGLDEMEPVRRRLRKEHPELAVFPRVAINGGNSVTSPTLPAPRGDLVAGAHSVTLAQGILSFDGHAIFRDVPASTYNLAATLIIASPDRTMEIPIGAYQDVDLRSKLYDTAYVDYSHGGITTFAHTGLPLTALPHGRYILGLAATQAGRTASEPELAVEQHEQWCVEKNMILGTRGTAAGRWEVFALPLIGREAGDCYIKETVCQVRDNRLFIEGYFAPRGRSIEGWGDIKYVLALAQLGTSPPNDRVVRSIPLAQASRPDVSIRAGEPWRNQSKGYYATTRYAGVELSDVAEGTYDLYVTAQIGDDIVTHLLDKRIRISGSWATGHRPTIGAIGSCVTRDNFSSRVVPGWKADYDFHGAQYQMSLISLMSPELDFDHRSYPDLDDHSLETTRRDFSKEYLRELQRDQPDYLLIDSFADARFGVIQVGGSWVTDNSWKIGTAAHYGSLKDHKRVTMRSDRYEYLRLFREACEKLRNFLSDRCPSTGVLIVAAREAARFRGLRETGRFPNAATSPLNQHWEELDAVLLDVFNCPRISPMDDQILASTEHVWGKGPVHYEQRYYDNVREQLLTYIGYAGTIELMAHDQ